jgi:LuxR family maltose regulon positive regulatory protein
MDSSLLATKTGIPPERPHLLPRSRLSDALEAGVPDSRIALITAPAGYGKTTLLAQWAHRSRHRIAWLSLERDDSDLERFLRYLITAWEKVQPGIMQTPVGLLLGSTSPDLDAVLPAFVNAASEIEDDMVFVLDDCHLIHRASVFQALTFLLDHLPLRLHLAIAGRAEPPLPLARCRARGELLELGVEDLRFQDEETSVFLGRWLPGDIPQEAIAQVREQLEGWPAGLQLACHAIRRRPAAIAPLEFSGKHRFLADYLNEEVLDYLDEATRRFLLRTSILDQLNGALCDTVAERSDSQQVLAALERDGLFLTPLDDTREWYRYQPLFAEVLREELRQRQPDSLATLHRRAAEWYLKQGMAEPAFSHAVAGSDIDLVTRIGEDYCVIKMESGELNVVARWLELIPPDWFDRNPLVDLMRVAFLIYTGAFEESASLLNSVEDRLRQSDEPNRREQLAKVSTVRCAIACFLNDVPSAERHASAALDDLPVADRVWRASIYHALGDTYSRNAIWDRAKESYRAALRVVHAPSSRIRAVHIFGALADLELRQGHLETAGRYWSDAIEAIQEREMWARLPIPVTGWVWIRMAELLYERNRLPEAQDHLARGLALAEVGGDVRALIAGHLLSARLHLADGDFALATEELERTRSVLDRASFPDWQVRCDRCQIELWLAEGRQRAVGRWVDARGTDGGNSHQDEPESDQLTIARALIARARAPDRRRALELLGDLIETAIADGRDGIQIEALALQAVALRADGDRAGALASLERSLRLAEPEGYVRLFADLGLPMACLLQEASDRDVMPEYVRPLLEVFAPALVRLGATTMAWPEPLSDRERDVLELMAAGLTNREIAARLFISPETVKKHAASIYAKLGVGRRIEAVARARELGLLDHPR